MLTDCTPQDYCVCTLLSVFSFDTWCIVSLCYCFLMCTTLSYFHHPPGSSSCHLTHSQATITTLYRHRSLPTLSLSCFLKEPLWVSEQQTDQHSAIVRGTAHSAAILQCYRRMTARVLFLSLHLGCHDCRSFSVWSTLSNNQRTHSPFVYLVLITSPTLF